MKYISKKPKVGGLQESRTGPRRRYVVPLGKGWAVRDDNEPTSRELYRTQAAALRAAQEMMRETGGEVLVKGRDGRFRGSFTIGRIGFERISAVEGLSLTMTIRREFEEFDRKRLSPDQRRKAITRKYCGKKP